MNNHNDELITILMPIYNGIEFIDESIKSIKEQTYKKWQLIIGINGHEKNSDVFKIANNYSDTNILILDLYNIKGKSNTLNEMLKYVNSIWIAILDVDDIWLPLKLEKQIPYLNNYDVIGTHCKYFGILSNEPKIPKGDLENFNFLLYNPIINSSSIIKKELCFWNNDINIEDYDLWLRLWKNGKKFYNVNSKGNNLSVKDLVNRYK
jgi:glycosyltransferase EpsE